MVDNDCDTIEYKQLAAEEELFEKFIDRLKQETADRSIKWFSELCKLYCKFDKANTLVIDGPDSHDIYIAKSFNHIDEVKWMVYRQSTDSYGYKEKVKELYNLGRKQTDLSMVKEAAIVIQNWLDT